MSPRSRRATAIPTTIPPIAIESESRIDPTCSISHTRTAAITPIVTKGEMTSRPSCGLPMASISLQARAHYTSSAAESRPMWRNSCSDSRPMAETVVRVAAIADLHCTKTSQGAFQALFSRIQESADVVLIAGDLTDYGLPEEARVLAKELAGLRVPMAAVLGNHD